MRPGNSWTQDFEIVLYTLFFSCACDVDKFNCGYIDQDEPTKPVCIDIDRRCDNVINCGGRLDLDEKNCFTVDSEIITKPNQVRPICFILDRKYPHLLLLGHAAKFRRVPPCPPRRSLETARS